MKNIFLYSFLVFIVSEVSAQQLADASDCGPKVFIENHGQVIDQYGKPNPNVLFLYHNGLFHLQLKKNGFCYEMFTIQSEGNYFYESGMQAEENQHAQKNSKLQSHRVDVTFAGANQNVVPQGADPINGYFNFIYAPVATNQHLHVPGFKRITYNNLYDGIDLVFYSSGENSNATSPRYEFIVHPGADLSKIKFRYEGATQLALDETGNFQLGTAHGHITETKPSCFVEGLKESIGGSFELKKNVKSFSRVNYDHSRYLIIDPNIIWGTYFGGDKADIIAEVSVGSDDKPVIDGHSVSLVHIASAGAYQSNFAGGIYDWYIAKFNVDGTLDWATYFGGDDKDYCFALDIDHEDNIIAGGNSESQGLATPGAFKDSVDGLKSDMLVAKFSPEGNLIWSTYFGGSGSEDVRNIVSDPDGSLYLSGLTGSDTGVASAGAYQDSLGGFDDALVAKFTSAGYPVWSTYYGDSGVDRLHAVALDLFGHVYVGGATSSTEGMTTPGAHQTVYSGGVEDCLLAKFDTSGQLIWGTYYGGTLDDHVRGVETDSTGNIYLGGFTNSDTLIATPGSFQDYWFIGDEGGTPTNDAFLSQFSPDGSLLWGTYLGGSHNEDLWGMTIDNEKKALYLGGSTNSIENIAYGNAIQPVKGGGEDCFLTKFFTDGSVAWSTYFGGPIGEQFEDIAVGQNGFVYAGAQTNSPYMITTPNVYQTIFYGGANDAMLYKFYGGNDCFDPFEPNETMAAAKAIFPYHLTDTTVYGYVASIGNSEDHDWYTFTVNNTQPNIRAIISDYAINYDLNLYNTQGILIYQSANAGSVPDTLSINGLSSGIYYLEVPHVPGAFDSLHCYRLQLLESDSLFPPAGIATQVSELQQPLKFLIHPNPVTKELSFFIPATSNERVSIVIYDMLDRIVYSDEIPVTAGGLQVILPIENFSDGSYSLVIRDNSGVRLGKFIKQ